MAGGLLEPTSWRAQVGQGRGGEGTRSEEKREREGSVHNMDYDCALEFSKTPKLGL
jgi:hypothetical protein